MYLRNPRSQRLFHTRILLGLGTDPTQIIRLWWVAHARMMELS